MSDRFSDHCSQEVFGPNGYPQSPRISYFGPFEDDERSSRKLINESALSNIKLNIKSRDILWN